MYLMYPAMLGANRDRRKSKQLTREDKEQVLSRRLVAITISGLRDSAAHDCKNGRHQEHIKRRLRALHFPCFQWVKTNEPRV